MPRLLIHIAILMTVLLLVAAPIMGEGQAASNIQYVGNPKTMKYHNSSCMHFNCKACTVKLSSQEEAKRKGYVACKKCKG